MCGMTPCLGPQAGVVLWSQLRRYPRVLLTYSSGIAAISSGKYEHFRIICDAQVTPYRPSSQSERSSPVAALAEVFGEGDVNQAFNLMPKHERKYVPQSEYLVKLFQPIMDDLLVVGVEYECGCERCEVLWARVCADRLMNERENTWGPYRRCVYKFRGRVSNNNKYGQVLKEAESERNQWLPL